MLVAAFSVHYTVERGDTLGEIARDHGVFVSDLVEANDISNPNLVFPGQVLTIPGEDGNVTHVVARGETLNAIAAQYGTTTSEIASANTIPNPDLILIGQKIIVPDGVRSSSSGGGSNSPSINVSTADDGITDRTGQYHIVKRGQSVSRIAALYDGVTANDIIRANGIVNGLIYAGSALYLGGPGHVSSGTSGSTSYTVKSGDRLGDIAHAHDVSVSALMEKNDISNPNLIRIGQVLAIPSGPSWVCPVQGASFKNDWGFPRGGGSRFHEGNDLFVSRGTAVRAPVSGTVTHSTGFVGGLQFRLEGSDGTVYIGTHMNEFGEDGRVSAGDVIGYVGNSGNAAGTPTHLHFGMYSQGAPVNPYPTLVKHGC